MLQEGIYHASGARPGNAFLILFLRVSPGQSAAQAGTAFAQLWRTYRGLEEGSILDLPGHLVPAGDLSVLVGYGVNAFELAGAGVSAPIALRQHGLFRSPLPTGGGPFLLGSGLRYGDDVRVNPATEEITVQFIANTQLAVNRAVVETWKVLHDLTDPETGAAPLLITGFYQGFQRDDGRSWIDFHDGVSNMRSEERAGAIVIKPSGAAAERWVEAGTYLAFIRLGVDLSRWRRLNRDQQELLVGRDKLSGCPVEATDEAGRPLPHRSCPIATTTQVRDPGNEAFREPPNAADRMVRMSHVQRANHHQGPSSDPSSLRIFRQGYEFLERIEAAPGFRVGLNFVSFQDTPERLIRMLRQPGWLGQTNFGGDPDQPLPGTDRLLTVRAAGVFLVPPLVDGEPFPGSGIFMGS